MTLETTYGKEIPDQLVRWLVQSSQEPTLMQVFPMFLLHVRVVAGVKSFGHILHFHVVLICCLKAFLCRLLCQLADHPTYSCSSESQRLSQKYS